MICQSVAHFLLDNQNGGLATGFLYVDDKLGNEANGWIYARGEAASIVNTIHMRQSWMIDYVDVHGWLQNAPNNDPSAPN